MTSLFFSSNGRLLNSTFFCAAHRGGRSTVTANFMASVRAKRVADQSEGSNSRRNVGDSETNVPNAIFKHDRVQICLGDALEWYSKWKPPTVIISDGAYGLSSFPGDPGAPEELADWYTPHVDQWSHHAQASTTLWFWNSEVGWATMHPVLIRNGWRYVHCVVWNKGISHIAGNCNTQTIRNFPVVTEVCAQYVREVMLPTKDGGKTLSIQDWLRYEWKRTGIPFARANDACGVASAATRKYLTGDDMWYFPPPEQFELLATYANLHGDAEGKPYFSVDGNKPLSADGWRKMRSSFKCPLGVTNARDCPTVQGSARLKVSGQTGHMNQKPECLFERLIESSAGQDGTIWEPFGGTCTGAAVCAKTNRQCFSAEINRSFYDIAVKRIRATQPIPSSATKKQTVLFH